VKDQVYRRSVTFFTTNEHVFSILATVYTAQQGLNEASKSTEAMKAGVNKGLEDVADLGRDLERAALKAGFGSTVSPASVQKLVDAISGYQIESLNMIADLRRESVEVTCSVCGEPIDDDARDAAGPESGADGSLAWMIHEPIGISISPARHSTSDDGRLRRRGRGCAQRSCGGRGVSATCEDDFNFCWPSPSA
jgi:hypothetical protein